MIIITLVTPHISCDAVFNRKIEGSATTPLELESQISE